MVETPLPATEGDHSQQIRVFISYSRDDFAFVDRLRDELEAQGITAHVDRDDIEKGEAWWERLQQLITESDSVVFVLSPTSANSEVCQQEVAFAVSLNKRLVPLIAKDLGEVHPPAALERLNYVFFVPDPRAGASGEFNAALNELLRAVRTDIGWIREHTRLGAIARRSEAQDQPKALMLRGPELAAAESWLASRPQEAPAPSDGLRRLITDSRHAETRRQRQQISGAFTVAVVAVSLAGFALVQWDRAEEQLRTATAQRLAVQSRAALSEALETGGLVHPDVDRSALLGLESLKLQHTLEADRALRTSLFNLSGSSREIRIPWDHQLLALGRDADWVAVGGSDGVAVIPAGTSGTRPPRTDELSLIEAETASFSTLAGATEDDYGTHPTFAVRSIVDPGEAHSLFDLELIDRRTAKPLAVLQHEWQARNSLFRDDGAFLATLTGKVSADPEDPSATRLFGSTFYVWEVPSGRLLSEMSFAGRGGVESFAIDPTGNWIALHTGFDDDGSTIVVMPIWPDLLKAEVCRRVMRNLSPTEVDSYLASSNYAGTCPGLPQISE